MVNGENGVTGATARQNILTEPKSDIDFVTLQRRNTVENIVR